MSAIDVARRRSRTGPNRPRPRVQRPLGRSDRAGGDPDPSRVELRPEPVPAQAELLAPRSGRSGPRGLGRPGSHRQTEVASWSGTALSRWRQPPPIRSRSGGRTVERALGEPSCGGFARDAIRGCRDGPQRLGPGRDQPPRARSGRPAPRPGHEPRHQGRSLRDPSVHRIALDGRNPPACATGRSAAGSPTRSIAASSWKNTLLKRPPDAINLVSDGPFAERDGRRRARRPPLGYDPASRRDARDRRP